MKLLTAREATLIVGHMQTDGKIARLDVAELVDEPGGMEANRLLLCSAFMFLVKTWRSDPPLPRACSRWSSGSRHCHNAVF